MTSTDSPVEDKSMRMVSQTGDERMSAEEPALDGSKRDLKVCFEFRKAKYCHCLQVCRYFHEGYDCIPFFRFGSCPRKGNCGYNHRPYLVELLKRKEHRTQHLSSESSNYPRRDGDFHGLSTVVDEEKGKGFERISEPGGVEEDVVSLPSDTEVAAEHTAEGGRRDSEGSKNATSVQNRYQPASDYQRRTWKVPYYRYSTRHLSPPDRPTFPHRHPPVQDYHYQSRSPRRDEEYVHRSHSANYMVDAELKRLERDLPSPWFVTRDQKGRVYFYNEYTRETTWEHPMRRGHFSYMDRKRRTPPEMSYPHSFH